MEGGNSNWSNDNSSRTTHNSPYAVCNCVPCMIARSTQNVARNHGPLTLGRAQEEGSRLLRNNIHSVINELGPLMHHARTAETHGLNLRSWLRRSQQAERDVPQHSTSTADSTIIDFGNINEPSTSHLQVNEGQPVRTTPPVYPISSTTTTLTEGSARDNFVNEQQENSNNATPNPSSNTASLSTNSENEGTQTTESASPEAQSLIVFFHKYVPFIIILLGKAIYDHRAGILIFLGLLITFTHADSVVKREIAKQGRRSFMSLSILFINLLVCICFIYYVFQEQKLYKSLIFIPPYSQPLSLWDLLWIVGITDFVLKFITIQLKAGMACFPARILPYSSRGKWYLMLECVSQLYRGLAPIQPWLYYLLESYQGPEKVIGVFLSAAYMVSKGTDLMSKVKLFKWAFWKLLQNVSLGVSPSKEQLDTAGAQCPICHDDYETPVLLHCRHVFCEACVTTWFDREQTCPLCRAKIADDPAWRDGATTFFAQLF